MGDQQKHIYCAKPFIARKGVFLDADEILAKLRKSRYSWAIYIPAATLVNVAATLSGSCLAAVMVGLLTFGIPFFLGARKLGTLLKAGTLILVLSGLLFGALYTYYLYDRSFVFEEKELKGTDLAGGAVSPYLGDEDTVYNFTVRYTGDEDPNTISVFANLTELGSLEEFNISLQNSGNVFYNETTLTANVHLYYFSWYSNTTKGWNETDFAVGPVGAPYSEMLVLQMFQGVILMFIPGGLFFYMIVLLYNSRKRSQEEQQKLAEQEKEITSKKKDKKEGEDEGGEEKERKEEVKGEYECTECGAEVPEDALFCHRCGEPFEGIEGDEELKKETEMVKAESDEFVCTECGADVPVDATVCPSCGESFDEDEEEQKDEVNTKGEEKGKD